MEPSNSDICCGSHVQNPFTHAYMPRALTKSRKKSGFSARPRILCLDASKSTVHHGCHTPHRTKVKPQDSCYSTRHAESFFDVVKKSSFYLNWTVTHIIRIFVIHGLVPLETFTAWSNWWGNVATVEQCAEPWSNAGNATSEKRP